MTKLGRWIAAIGLWLLYGACVGLVLAACSPKLATGIFAATAAFLYAVLIAVIFKLK